MALENDEGCSVVDVLNIMPAEDRAAQFRFDPRWWEKVHQGGLHEVWCNGGIHIRTRGRQIDRAGVGQITDAYMCDCARWGNKDGA